MSTQADLLELFKTEPEYRRFFESCCKRGCYRLRAQAWQFREELSARSQEHSLEEVEDALWELARLLLPDSPAAAWDMEWAGELAEKALRYLNERHIPGADLSVLEPLDKEVTAAGVSEDRGRYRAALREYMKVGLQEFRRAGGTAA